MKQFIFKLLFIFSLSFISQSIYCQNNSISINHEFVNASLEEVLHWIEDNHPVKIAFSKEAISGIVVNQRFEDIPLDQFFKTLLSSTSLTYRFVQENRILIGPIEQLSLSQSPEVQSLYTLQGKIIDHNGNALAFANIFNEKKQKGTYSNEEGHFEWPTLIELDSILLEVSFLGYEKQTLVVKDFSQPLLVKLKPSSHFFKEVEVVDFLPGPKFSPLYSNNKSSTDIPRVAMLPGGIDLFRNIQLLPGIKANDHLSAKLRVRGGNTDENLIILDGMTLYNIDHFYGFFSAIHPGIFEDIQVFKNAFPIEFNGRTSSIVQLKSPGISKKKGINGTLGLDFISANALIEASPSSNMSLRAAGRFTHQDIANSPFFQLTNSESFESRINIRDQEKVDALIQLSPAFKFNDLYLNWQWAPGSGNLFNVSIFSGFDRYKYNYTETYKLFQNAAGRVSIKEEGLDKMEWRNNAYGIQYQKKWSESFQSSWNVNYSTYKTDQKEGFTLTQIVRNMEKVRAAPRSNKLNTIEGFRFNQKNEWLLSQKSSLTFGYSFLNEEINFQLTNSNGLDSRDISKIDNSNTHSFYFLYNWSPLRSLSFDFGINALHYTKLGGVYGSPRIQAKYQISNQFSLKGSWSLYQQFLRQLYHEDVFGKNQAIWVLAGTSKILPQVKMPFIRSEHFMLGTRINSENWELDIEFFNKQRDGIVEYTLRRPGFNQDGVITEPVFGFFLGNGWTKGVDVLLKKKGQKYNGWISYTLSRSMHRLRGVNFYRPFPAPDDSRHQLSWINNYSVNQQWMFSLNYIYASGLPYLDYSRVREIPTDRRSFSYNNFLERFKAYHRMDFSLNYSTRLLGMDSQFGLSIFNVLNRNNVKYRQFVFSVQEEQDAKVLGTEIELLPRIWNASWEIRF